MAEKVKVSQEIANAIELAKEKHGDYLLHEVLRKLELNSKFRDELAPLNKLLNTQRVLAITVGYEIKYTPYETIAIDYHSALKSRNETTSSYKERFFDGYLLGVESTLETLGIEIEGIK